MDDKKYFFLLIDDDSINNLVCESLLKKIALGSVVKSFLKAQDALEYLADAPVQESVLLLDINMPEMDGWEFLELFIKHHPQHHQASKVFILSSSIDKSDFEKAKSYPSVLDYVVKPLNKAKIEELLQKVEIA
jgi:CheY-like chemotaxis protein